MFFEYLAPKLLLIVWESTQAEERAGAVLFYDKIIKSEG